MVFILANALQFCDRSTIRRQSLHLGRTVAGSVGNYLPDAITEMWEPTRDFAYLKLPSSGVQSVVALSKYANLETLFFNKIYRIGANYI